ncbi:hypothetical protein [Emticicia sp. C21]|uniref:hypothetical protein n=1 Tax=Emticicia sp. C21 TaxID=2302915 RepID=UPI000E34A867|nr:hypothetical protein [Emticicia sp. C21]RFS14155.1 hypothetical protein D0T08_23210 [Emticicia sp. C21]
MKHILLIIFSFFSLTAFAQSLSEEQLQKYLNALQKEEIISEFGKDGFLKAVSKDNAAIKQRLSGIPFAGLNKIPDSLFKSRAAILGFVGIFEVMRNVGSAADELVQLREMSEKILGESMYFKPDIEGEINAKNPLSFLGLEQNLKPSKENYQLLADKLRAIQLIDKNVYDELLKWLEKDRIKLINDFGFFIYAAKQTWFYDNYASQKNIQFKFIDSLQTAKMLSKEKADLLKQSYKPYELKSKIDIISLCNNVVVIPKEQGNFTREEIYENLFNEVKTKLLPEFAFSDFSVKELVKSDNELSFDSPMGLPFRNPMDKDKKSYRLQYSVKGLNYAQKADTDFSWFKTLQKSIPPDVYVDTNIIKSYAILFSPLIGINSKDFQSINDYLIDTKSDKRLIIVANEINPLLPVRDARKALILVDSTQSLVFKTKIQDNAFLANLLGSEKSDFSDKFSREKLTAIIKDFQDNDILQVDTKESIDKAIVDFRFESGNRNNVKRSLLLSFPDIIAKVNFTPKTETEKINSFKSFIAELARVSHNQFKPEKVTDNFETEIVKSNEKDRNLVMSFRVKDKKYEYKQEIPRIDKELLVAQKGMKANSYLNFDNVSLNEYQLIELINAALEENKIDGTYYKINGNIGTFTLNNQSNYIFLTKKQYDYIDKNYSEVFNEPVAENAYHSYQEQIAAFSTEDFANALQRENMLTEEAKKTLDLKKSKEPSDVLKASGRAVLIDLNELVGKNNTEIYSYILNKFGSKLLPDTKFGEINYKKTSKDSDSTEYNEYILSLKINGKAYEQSLYVSLSQLVKNAIDSLKNEKSQYFPGIGENQFKVINDYLTDISSPHRLVIVCDYRSPILSFVLFDSTQANLVAETLPNNYVDFSMYNREFSRDSLQNTLFEFGRVGLIEPMNDSQKETFILKFRRLQGSGKSLLEALPKVIVKSNMWELDNYKDVYKSMIDSLKTISKGHFNPIKVEDNFQKMLKKGESSDRTFKFSFELNNKKYSESQFIKGVPKTKSKDLQSDYDYFEFDTAKLIELVNKALTEQNSDYAFYELSGSDDDEDLSGPQFIFLSAKQYRWIKNKYPDIFENEEDTRMYDSDKIEDKNKN